MNPPAAVEACPEADPPLPASPDCAWSVEEMAATWPGVSGGGFPPSPSPVSREPARFVFFLSCAVSVGCCSMMVAEAAAPGAARLAAWALGAAG